MTNNKKRSKFVVMFQTSEGTWKHLDHNYIKYSRANDDAEKLRKSTGRRAYAIRKGGRSK